MIYQQTTQVPNIMFDTHLPVLSGAELKLVLVIIRQTYGWIDQRTGLRKTRDRISYGQFIQKTKLSRRVITKALVRLSDIGLIRITCQYGNILLNPEDRRGKTSLFYSLNICTKRQEHVHFRASTCAQSAHNKTNYTKIKETKLRRGGVRSVGEVLRSY